MCEEKMAIEAGDQFPLRDAAMAAQQSNRAVMGTIGRRDIGWAVKQMWNGQKVSRHGWNGRGMYIALQTPDLGSKMSAPYVYIRTAHGDLIPWLCSQGDLLATDWHMHEVH